MKPQFTQITCCMYIYFELEENWKGGDRWTLRSHVTQQTMKLSVEPTSLKSFKDQNKPYHAWWKLSGVVGEPPFYNQRCYFESWREACWLFCNFFCIWFLSWLCTFRALGAYRREDRDSSVRKYFSSRSWSPPTHPRSHTWLSNSCSRLPFKRY